MSRVVVVTGGASGIGQAVVERLARDDFTGVIIDINEEGGRRVAAEHSKARRTSHVYPFGCDPGRRCAENFSKNYFGSRPRRCSRQRCRRQLASTQDRRVSIGPLASSHRCQFDLDFLVAARLSV